MAYEKTVLNEHSDNIKFFKEKFPKTNYKPELLDIHNL